MGFSVLRVLLLLASRGIQVEAGGAGADQAQQDLADSNIKYNIKKEGAGGWQVHPGDTVTVHAVGSLQEGGQEFWSTRDEGKGAFTFTAGSGGTHGGWEKGVIGMKKGERRALSVPAEEGYGSAGKNDWGVPPNAALTYEIELLTIKAKPSKKGKAPQKRKNKRIDRRKKKRAARQEV